MTTDLLVTHESGDLIPSGPVEATVTQESGRLVAHVGDSKFVAPISVSRLFDLRGTTLSGEFRSLPGFLAVRVVGLYRHRLTA